MSFQSGGTCVLAWKRRDGLGGRLRRNKWEQRWFFLADGRILYYGMGDEDRFGEEDYAPRGSIDLQKTKCRIEVTSNPSPDAPTPNEVEIVSEEVVVPASQPTDKPKKPNITKWRLCFDNQQALVEFLEKAHAVLQDYGQLQEKDTQRFEHEFQPGDHIYRWEMIVCPPVIYPIQIHGIVLEAGRNCVVVADFGLTGYGKKSAQDDFHHASEADKEQHNRVVAAFKKLRPNSSQRLHITTLTDPIEIRKWNKAHYDENSYIKPGKFNKLSKFFHRRKANFKEEAIPAQIPISKSADNSPDQSDDEDGEDSNDSSHKDTSSTLNRTRSFSEDYAQKRQEEHPLPKADPVDIVLSRANFLLEYGEEKLPPYHVFFSNSECIAVWCKTGRWSTLQTAVFLSSNAIGGAKSATVATLGVAAAHAILAPVVAIGGLLWVSAPMVILQKSRKQWEANTQLMTDLYWQWAPPKIFVSAIEHWSEIGYTTQEQRILEQEKKAIEEAAEAAALEKTDIKKYTTKEILANKMEEAVEELEKESTQEQELSTSEEKN